MSCLFDSLEYFLKISSKDIRTKICDYLENSNQLVEGLDTKDLLDIESEDYIRKMRKKSTWGGGIEIKSACNIWNLRIFVINLRRTDTIDKSNPWIEFVPNNQNNPKIKIIFLTWNGYHYEPLKNITDPEHFIKELEKYSFKKNKKNNADKDNQLSIDNNIDDSESSYEENNAVNTYKQIKKENKDKKNKKNKREKKESRKKNKKSGKK